MGGTSIKHQRVRFEKYHQKSFELEKLPPTLSSTYIHIKGALYSIIFAYNALFVESIDTLFVL